MSFWDSHCHLFHEYYEDIPLIIKESCQSDVTNFIVSGTDNNNNNEIMETIEEYSNVFGVIGIHPENADSYSIKDLGYIEEHLKNKKILGIGEIGLDYHYTRENIDKQKDLFLKQLKLAEKYDVPVVIHSRDATEDTINILKKVKVRGVIHSFSGSLETAEIYIKMGFCLGINGVITFKNCNLKNILPNIFSHILLETDSPYLTPQPYRGTVNTPKYIRNIAEFIAEYLNISVRQIEKVTNENIASIFDKSNEL